MTIPAEYQVNVLPTDSDEYILSRFFSSGSTDDFVACVHWMIEQLPTPLQQANARVALMLSLRHPAEED
jgi:hypothetical protein